MTASHPSNTDTADDIMAAGMAASQLVYDESMARFGLLLEVWLHESRATLDSKPSPSTQGSHETDAVVVPQAA